MIISIRYQYSLFKCSNDKFIIWIQRNPNWYQNNVYRWPFMMFIDIFIFFVINKVNICSTMKIHRFSAYSFGTSSYIRQQRFFLCIVFHMYLYGFMLIHNWIFPSAYITITNFIQFNICLEMNSLLLFVKSQPLTTLKLKCQLVCMHFILTVSKVVYKFVVVAVECIYINAKQKCVLQSS